MKFIKSRWFVPILIFLIALSLRYYRLPEIFLFGADEEYQATYARTIAEDFHLVWIGVSAAGTGFYLGPYWTYLTALLLKISAGDPLITGYFAATLGAITAFAIYYLGKEIVSRRAAIFASIFYAFSTLTIYFDQKYWNPSSLPLLALLMVYSLVKLKIDHRFLYLFCICLGLLFHVHLSLVPLALFLTVINLPSIAKSGRKVILIGLACFIITIAPLIAFDYFHKGSNITTPLRWGEIKSGLKPGGAIVNGQTWVYLLGRLWHLNPGKTNANEARPTCTVGSVTTPPLALSLIAITPIIFAGFNLISFAYLSIVIPFIFYPGANYEYYLLGSLPLYFLLAGKLIVRLPKAVSLFIVILLFITSIITIFRNTSPYGLEAKKELIKKTLAVIGDKPFSLTEQGICHRYEGWRYLYTVYGRYPVTSSIDGTYGWLYPKEISSVEPAYNIEIYGTGSPAEQDNVVKLESGGFTAFIQKLF